MSELINVTLNENQRLKESKGLKWEGVQTLVTPKGRETFNILLNS